MGKILPIILAVVGIVAGGAIGFVLKPAPDAEQHDGAEGADGEKMAAKEHGDGHGAKDDHGESAKHGGMDKPTRATDSEYMPLSRKLIVPFRRENGRKAFVAIDINLELAPGELHHAEAHEPKLVDAFLRTLVAFAATGAFDDDTHAAHILRELNSELLVAGQAVLGEAIRQVLIANLLTQDA